MKKILLLSLPLIIFSAFFLLPTRTLAATNYYIAANGSTSNTGTSASSPWPFSKVGTFAFSPGDTILFNKGDTFTGTITFASSGTLSSPITFDIYGTAINNPLLTAAGAAAPVITVTGNYINFKNLMLENSTSGNAILYLSSVHDIIVNNCFFTAGYRGILINNTTGGIDITHNYFTGFTVTSATSAYPGNKIQVTNSTLSTGSVHIDGNFLYEPVDSVNIGDQISFWKAYGTPTYGYTATNNEIEGGSINSSGYTGINPGDTGGSYQTVTGNTIVNSGSTGIQMTGGDNITISDNYIYGAQRTSSTDGITYGAYYGVPKATVATISNNHINWTQASGNRYNKWWDTSTQTVQPTGWTTNTPDSTADPLAPSTLLPNPLWTGSPWNTAGVTTGTTYYIAANGSTANTGTSALSPWPFSKVASIPFTAGTQILFNKGDTFSGAISVNASGTAAAPIVFDAYGTGNNPVIDTGGSTTSNTMQINGSYVTVNNLVLQNSQLQSGIVYIGSSVHDVTIYNCYINNGVRGINVVHSGSNGVANIKVLNNYFTKIADAPTHPYGGGSAVQFNNVNGSGVEIAYNRIYIPMIVSPTDPNTANLGVGDLISLYQSNGTATSLMLVHDNAIRGGSSNLDGYDAIGLGDVGGSYQSAYNNTVVNGGLVPLQIVGGHDINASYNNLYGAQLSYNMQGITYGFYGTATSPYNTTAGYNKINVTDKNGLAYSWFVSPGLANPTNWSTNTPQYSVDTSVCNAMLPDPLWTGTPWNNGASNPVIGSCNGTTSDTTHPTVSITTPTSGSTVSGSSVAFTASASDNVGVASVQFVLDGQLTGSPDTTAPYTMTWDTTAVANGAHTISAVAKDAAGNIGTSSVVSVTVNNTATTTTATAPVISSIAVTPAQTSANLTFNTDQATSNVITWGTTTAYTGGSVYSGSYLTSHAIYMGSLTAGTTYHFHVVSTAQSGLVTTSSDQTFTTTGTAPTTPVVTPTPTTPAPVITNLSVVATAHAATITWTTDQLSDGQVEYGTTTNYGSFSALNSTPTTSHSFTLYNLMASTDYHFAVESTANGTQTISADGIFTTSRISKHGNGNNVTLTSMRIAASQFRVQAAADVTPPIATLTTPIGGSTISGLVTFSAIASDNVGVTSVQFTINNTVVSEPTVGPYTFTWDSTNVPNGGYIINAIAYDAAGNTATTPTITVTVNNPVPILFGKTAPIITTPVTPPAATTTTTVTSGGGGGGGAATVTVPTTTTTTTTVTTTPVATATNSGNGGSGAASTSTNTTTTATVAPLGCTVATAFSPLTGQQCSSQSVATASSGTGIAAELTRTLYIAGHDDEVVSLQHFLNTNGFSVTVSGPGSLNNETTYFGPATRAAVRAFQAAHGIPTTGVVGPLTRAAINQILAGVTTTTTATSTASGTQQHVSVTVRYANVRSAGSLTAPVITTLSYGAQGTVLGTAGYWINATFSNGITGWISKAVSTIY